MRKASTSAIAALPARVAATSGSAFIRQLRDQALELGDVLTAELFVRREMCDQRRELAAEQAVEQILALLVHVSVALQHRAVEIAPAVLDRGDGALVEQAIEQGLYRGVLPLPRVAERGDDFLGAQRMARPEHLHDRAFGFADRHIDYMRKWFAHLHT